MQVSLWPFNSLMTHSLQKINTFESRCLKTVYFWSIIEQQTSKCHCHCLCYHVCMMYDDSVLDPKYYPYSFLIIQVSEMTRFSHFLDPVGDTFEEMLLKYIADKLSV